MARWHLCNILGAHRLWLFDAKGDGFVLNREHSVAAAGTLPARFVAKSWSSLWQPRLNIAWLPPESVFLRVIELPISNFDETLAMAELQLEKLSPIPAAQIVWSIHILPRRDVGAKTDAAHAGGELQSVVVVIAERRAVEEFLGGLEDRGYLADRLETPMLDQLEATSATNEGAAPDARIYPTTLGGHNAALIAWWVGGALRNLGVVVLPPDGDRVKSLKDQLAQLAWAGELEGWLTAPPRWHLVADPVSAAEWEAALRGSLEEPVPVAPPLPPAELAARTARRAAAADARANLLPAEFSSRYRQQFVDRLWLRGLTAAGALYAVCVAIYLCATNLLAYRVRQVEGQVTALSGNYTNALLLKARCQLLNDRQEFKYAALDCWKLVADQLPPDVILQRFAFTDGQLALNGTVPVEQSRQVTDFNDAMRKAKLNDQSVFDSSGGDTLSSHTMNGIVNWNFSLQLKRVEATP